jgi:hypothetical protein
VTEESCHLVPFLPEGCGANDSTIGLAKYKRDDRCGFRLCLLPHYFRPPEFSFSNAPCSALEADRTSIRYRSSSKPDDAVVRAHAAPAP